MNNNVKPMVDWHGSNIKVGAKVRLTPQLVFAGIKDSGGEEVGEVLGIEERKGYDPRVLVDWGSGYPVPANPVLLEVV